jgi:hypothetical protein
MSVGCAILGPMAVNSQQRELLHRRSLAQGIGATTAPVEAASRLLAMQAQDFAAARWALGIRSGVVETEVLESFDRGEIVRAWTMRGTLFAVPAVDLAWMLSLTAPRMLAQAASRRAELQLDDAVIERARGLARTALEGGGSLLRSEVMTLLAENGIDPSGQRGYHLIAHLAQTGTWCWGPTRGTEQALVLHDEWIASPRRLEREEALGEFVLRYFTGHGPATIRDFAAWTRLTLADARRGLAVAGDRLAEFGAGSGLWTSAEAASVAISDAEKRAFARSIRILPGFDESYLGYADRSAFIDPTDEPVIVPGGNGVFQPTILAAGRVVGTWARSYSKAGVAVEARPFAELSVTAQRGFRRAAADYARFVGRPLRVAQ